MSDERVEARPALPALRRRERPEPGQRTWMAPASSYFGACTGTNSCTAGASCPVGVVVTLGCGPYGCDCACHDGGARGDSRRHT